MSQFDELPEGWINVHLQDLTLDPRNEIVDGPFGSNLRASEYQHKGIPIIRLQNIDRNFFIEKNIKYISIEKSEELKRHSFISGDIVITKLGDPLGKACLVPSFLNFGIIVADIVRVRISEEFSNKIFLMNFINSPLAISQLEKQTKGTTRSRVNLNHIRSLEIPLPPLNEQRRIVEKIEALTARSRKAREALEAIPNLLDQFRQSVLAAAFRGDLTADWREQNLDVEPAEELLERIRAERRKQWEEAELKKMRAKGQEPKNDKWKEKYKEPSSVKLNELPKSPNGWSFTLLEPLLSISRPGMKTGPFGSLLKKEDHQNTGFPVLGIENISASGFVPGNKIFISDQKAADLSEYKVIEGDILISRSGTVGEVCVVPSDIGEAIISTNLIRVSIETGMLPEYFCKLFRGSGFVLNQVKELCSGSTRDFLNQTILYSIIFPIPPLNEQKEILRRIDNIFVFIDQISSQVESTFEQCDFLDQSILAKAFRGELVPQDPNDEPAAVLLERIRAERERLGNSKKRGKAKT